MSSILPLQLLHNFDLKISGNIIMFMQELVTEKLCINHDYFLFL